MSTIKKIAIYSFCLFSLVILTGVIISTVYEDEVELFALEKIRAAIKSEINIEEVDLSVLKRFPNASLELKNLFLEDLAGDTLVHAGSAFLEFNIMDLFEGKYIVESIQLEDARVRMLRYEDGSDNYQVWENNESDSGSFRFSLEQMSIDDSRFSYSDHRSEYDVLSDLSNFIIKGGIEDSLIKLQVEGDIDVRSMSVSDVWEIGNKSFNLNSAIVFNTESEQMTFHPSELTSNGIDVEVRGLVDVNNDLISLKYEGSGISVPVLRNLLPFNLKNEIKDLQTSGVASINGYVKGAIGDGRVPDFGFDYTLKKGKLQHRSSDVGVDYLTGKGEFHWTKNGPVKLIVKEGTAEFRKSEIDFSGGFTQTEKVEIQLQIIGDIRLDELKKVFLLDTLEVMEGEASIEANYTAVLDSWSAHNLIGKSVVNGKATLQDGRFKMKGYHQEFEELNGVFILNNDDAIIEDFRGEIQDQEFQLNGFLRGLMPFILEDNRDLGIETNLTMEKLLLDEFLSTQADDKEAYKLDFPDYIAWTAKVEIDQLIFRDFEAREIRGIASLKNDILTINPLSMKTAGGEFQAKGSMTQIKNGDFQIDCTADINGIDIKELFVEFENFGQEFLREDHVKGTATAHIDFKSELGSDLNLDTKTVQSVIDLSIENGELIAHESLLQIGDYIQQKALLAQMVDGDEFKQKLRRIAFSTLKNEIRIHDGIVEIPNMEIKSSAMDITAQGYHGFNHSIDYSIAFRLRDLLKSKDESEFGTVEDDGLGSKFFLAMKGTTAKPEFSFDKQAAKEERKGDFAQIKDDFKNIFKKKEKDSAVPSTSPEAGSGITISWDEIDEGEQKTDSGKGAEAKESDKENPKKKKGILGKIFKEEKEKEVEFEEDDEDF